MNHRLNALIFSLMVIIPMYALLQQEVLPLLEGKANIIPVAIVGSGPAGVAASIPPVRAGYHTVIFTGNKPGGEIMDAILVENWPGLPKMKGAECMHLLEKQAIDLGAHLVPASVTHIDFESWPYKLTISNGAAAYALTIILAMGASQKEIGIEGEHIYWGKALFSCGSCDSSFTRDKDTVVFGNGNIAVQRILQLAPMAGSVTLIVPESRLIADDSMIGMLKGLPNVRPPLFNKKITKLIGDGKVLSQIELEDLTTRERSTFDTTSVFLSEALTPNTDLIKQQLALDSAGCIKLKDGVSQETSIDGVMAAGTIANNEYRQLPVIMGEGTKAGMDALHFLGKWGLDGSERKAIQNHLYLPNLNEPSFVVMIEKPEDLKALYKRHTVLAEFYSPSCATCNAMDIPINNLAATYKDILKITKISRNTFPTLFDEYKVKMVPTFILFEKGSEVSRIEGVFTKEDLLEFLRDEGIEI